jgi:hypothetical protein
VKQTPGCVIGAALVTHFPSTRNCPCGQVHAAAAPATALGGRQHSPVSALVVVPGGQPVN